MSVATVASRSVRATAVRWGARSALSAFAIALAATLTIGLLEGKKPFYFDSGGYWELGETFTQHGHFSLLNFNSPLRGYLLPLINHLLRVLALGLGWSFSFSVVLFNAFTFAAIGALLAPRLAEIVWPQQRWGLVRRLALTGALLVFWRGYLSYPLSDFPALAMALVALIAIAVPDRPGSMLIGGLACAAAIEMRPAYLVLAPLLAILVSWRWLELGGREDFPLARRALCLGLLVFGFALVALPQSLATNRHFHSVSFIPGSVAHLTSLQLTEGLRLQRYETFVGGGHPPRMLYTDPTGTRLLSEQKEQTITGTGQYLGLVVSHPVTMAGLFLRHLVNGGDQRYDTPYVSQLSTGSNRLLRIAGFALFFLALVRIAWASARRELGRARWRFAVALALCCATSVPSAVEPRYLLPAFLLSYMLVLSPWPNPFRARLGARGLRQWSTLAALGVALAVYAVIVILVTSAASSNLTFGAV
ncbi:MAG TPA: hypothetical protein VGH09_03220 [Solirubrobacteraceae bacterium]